MREYLSWSVRARVRSNVVLPSPGTPSNSTWPPESRQISTPSTTSSWPTMILAISRRTAFNRSTAFWRVASDATFFIVEQQTAHHGIGQAGNWRNSKIRCSQALRFRLKAALLAHLANQYAQHGSHLRQRLAGLLRRHGPRQERPEAHQFRVEHQQLVLDRCQFQIGGVLDEVREHVVVALQGAFQGSQVAFGFQALQHGRDIETLVGNSGHFGTLPCAPQQHYAAIAQPVNK